MRRLWRHPEDMPSFYQKEQEWLTLSYHTHDLFCSCPDPHNHLLRLLTGGSNHPWRGPTGEPTEGPGAEDTADAAGGGDLAGEPTAEDLDLAAVAAATEERERSVTDTADGSG